MIGVGLAIGFAQRGARSFAKGLRRVVTRGRKAEEERAVEEVAHVEDGGGGGSAHQRRDVRVSVGGGIGFRTIA